MQAKATIVQCEQTISALRQQVHTLTVAISEKEAELDSATFRFRQETAELNESIAAAEGEIKRRVVVIKQLEQQLADAKVAFHQSKGSYESSHQNYLTKIQVRSFNRRSSKALRYPHYNLQGYTA